MDFGLEIQKTNVGIRISILETSRVPIFRQNKQRWPFRRKRAHVESIDAFGMADLSKF